MKRIIIVGTRRRNSIGDCKQINAALLFIYKKGDIIVSGGCPKGGDWFAEILAKRHHIPIEIFKADWKKFGRPAGFIRNTEIAKYGDEIIACVAPDRKGGTEDTIKKFKKFHPNGKIHLC